MNPTPTRPSEKRDNRPGPENITTKKEVSKLLGGHLVTSLQALILIGYIHLYSFSIYLESMCFF